MNHGKCKSVFANGDIYIGEMSNAKRHGKGIYTRADNTIYHDGEWENSLPKK
jgi:hypothetical protein